MGRASDVDHIIIQFTTWPDVVGRKHMDLLGSLCWQYLARSAVRVHSLSRKTPTWKAQQMSAAECDAEVVVIQLE